MFNPEKNSPIKINIERLQQGLSKNQMKKIDYECNLLRKTQQELIYLAPFLFTEGTTAANTTVISGETFTPSAEATQNNSNYEEFDNYQYYYDSDMG